MVVFNGERTKLPYSLPPEQSLALQATIKIPNQLGRYKLVLTMVQEGIAWFDTQKADSPKIFINIISPQS